MVNTEELIIVGVFIFLLIGFVIYLIVANSNNWWPFNPYEHPPPDDPDRIFQPIKSVEKLTEKQIQCNQWIVCNPPYASGTKPGFCEKKPFTDILAAGCPCSAEVCDEI